MSIRFACGCGRKLTAREEFAGRQMKCPQCGRELAIPQPQPAAVGAGATQAGAAVAETTAQGPHTPPPDASATEPVLEAFTETPAAPEPVLLLEPADAATAEPVAAAAPAPSERAVVPAPRASY